MIKQRHYNFRVMTMSAIIVVVLVACSVLVGVVFLSGFAMTVSSAITHLAEKSLVLTTFLVMFVCLLLATCLPVAISYLIFLGQRFFFKMPSDSPPDYKDDSTEFYDN